MLESVYSGFDYPPESSTRIEAQPPVILTWMWPSSAL